jgi:hypothetical protein
MGMLKLACRSTHPYTKKAVTAFPILPVGFRTNPDLAPNPLGRKYEKLVAFNSHLDNELPDIESDEGLEARILSSNSELDSLLSSLVLGTGIEYPGPRARSLGSCEDVLALLHGCLDTINPEIAIVARCCGLALETASNG